MSFDLTTARVNRGLSQRAAAKAIGVHPASIRSLERRETVHPATAKKVADFFDCKVTDLMPLDVAPTNGAGAAA